MMRKKHAFRWAVFLPLILFISLIAGAMQAEALEAKSFIWEVTSDTATVFVMGSIHAARPDMYPLSPAIEGAFKKSSCLVVEVNPFTIDEKKMQAIIEKKGYYPANDQIGNHIQTPLYHDLTTYLQQAGIPLERVSGMRPGFLSFSLTAAHMIKLGYLPENGVDLYFLKKAKDRKQILALETMEEQLNLLLDMPDENLYLKYTLSDLENAGQILQVMTSAWLNGDAQGMYDSVIGPYITDPEMRPLLDRLFFQRNLKMTAKIKGLLRTGLTSFVVVGAGHLVGEKGIVELLKQDHYKVRQLGKN
ncbi:MAG: TraB/GumN family protein [Proteobacteria bacterium]|nr:TraB/GumN family protein [Pseudomonadota bacterium]MBU4472363.1 TraB/GumN family protein [Pseudomonadota bacterium]MCG2752058.1 TraB/GumN family protein [Desulfobacteraceae bacterium]